MMKVMLSMDADHEKEGTRMTGMRRMSVDFFEGNADEGMRRMSADFFWGGSTQDQFFYHGGTEEHRGA